jgi:hypothetical protein
MVNHLGKNPYGIVITNLGVKPNQHQHHCSFLPLLSHTHLSLYSIVPLSCNGKKHQIIFFIPRTLVCLFFSIKAKQGPSSALKLLPLNTVVRAEVYAVDISALQFFN